MRTYPEDESDQKELARLNAEPWMVEQLKLNPEYVHWGPHEDYMGGKPDEGWRSPILKDTWTDLIGKQPELPEGLNEGFTLDELNEVVHFYFHLNRPCIACEVCDQSGYNPATKELSETFYRRPREGTQLSVEELSNALIFGRTSALLRPDEPGWCHELTDEEIQYLRDEHRIFEGLNRPMVTNDQIRADYMHDAINTHMLVKHRAKRLGVYGTCPACEGHGYIYTAPAASLSLTFWLIHPRKGASRGVEVKTIQQHELPAVYAFLKAAAQRNAERFSKIP